MNGWGAASIGQCGQHWWTLNYLSRRGVSFQQTENEHHAWICQDLRSSARELLCTILAKFMLNQIIKWTAKKSFLADDAVEF